MHSSSNLKCTLYASIRNGYTKNSATVSLTLVVKFSVFEKAKQKTEQNKKSSLIFQSGREATDFTKQSVILGAQVISQ